MANISGSFTGTGTDGKVYIPKIGERMTNAGYANIWLSGTAVTTVQLEKSPDNGTTWFACYAANTQLYQWPYSNSGSGNYINETFQEQEQGVIYRLNCTSYTSGTLNYQITGPL